MSLAFPYGKREATKPEPDQKRNISEGGIGTISEAKQEQIFEKIQKERGRQAQLWGDQWDPGVTPSHQKAAILIEEALEVVRRVNDYHPVDNLQDPELEEELVQLAAVAVAWLESMMWLPPAPPLKPDAPPGREGEPQVRFWAKPNVGTWQGAGWPRRKAIIEEMQRKFNEARKVKEDFHSRTLPIQCPSCQAFRWVSFRWLDMDWKTSLGYCRFCGWDKRQLPSNEEKERGG